MLIPIHGGFSSSQERFLFYDQLQFVSLAAVKIGSTSVALQDGFLVGFLLVPLVTEVLAVFLLIVCKAQLFELCGLGKPSASSRTKILQGGAMSTAGSE